MQVEINSLLEDMNDIPRNLDASEQQDHASPMEGLSLTLQDAKNLQDPMMPPDVNWE